jgi:hypothetical protein
MLSTDGAVPQAYQDDYIRFYLKDGGDVRYLEIFTRDNPDDPRSGYNGMSKSIKTDKNALM